MRSTRHVVEAEKDEGPSHYSAPPVLVLASPAGSPKHGHAMIEDIGSLCGARLGPGTLYGVIARLEQRGWIEPLPPAERRQPCRITADGLRVLHTKLTPALMQAGRTEEPGGSMNTQGARLLTRLYPPS
jgi:DNA-binding PadR family transcriptional regulator